MDFCGVTRPVHSNPEGGESVRPIRKSARFAGVKEKK
jgi:hypothetical protein